MPSTSRATNAWIHSVVIDLCSGHNTIPFLAVNWSQLSHHIYCTVARQPVSTHFYTSTHFYVMTAEWSTDRLPWDLMWDKTVLHQYFNAINFLKNMHRTIPKGLPPTSSKTKSWNTQREPMQKRGERAHSTQKDPDLELEPSTPCCQATVLITASPCCSIKSWSGTTTKSSANHMHKHTHSESCSVW